MRKQEDILRKVRALLARANSTEFEGERQSCLNKADQLMTAYAIEEWQLASGVDDKQKKLVVRRDMDVTWWWATRGMPELVRNEIAWLWDSCVRHCRCFTTFTVWNYNKKTAAVYGLASDLNYLDILFTDLYLQMSEKLRPTYKPELSLGANIMRAKESGMKYAQIAVWLGHPEWVDESGRRCKSGPGGRMLKAYKEHLETLGRRKEDMVTIHPTTWANSFVAGFTHTVKMRLHAMAQSSEQATTGDLLPALRDIREQAREALWDDFPDVRPHPPNCECKDCVASRKPVKASRGKDWTLDYRGMAEGSKAGEQARIRTSAEPLKSQKELK